MSKFNLRAYKDGKNNIVVDINPSIPCIDDPDLRKLALALESYLDKHGWINTIRDEPGPMKFPGVEA